MNLIKDIGPPVEESESDSQKGRREKNKRGPRPWDKKPKTEIAMSIKHGPGDISDTMSNVSNSNIGGLDET